MPLHGLNEAIPVPNMDRRVIGELLRHPERILVAIAVQEFHAGETAAVVCQIGTINTHEAPHARLNDQADNALEAILFPAA